MRKSIQILCFVGFLAATGAIAALAQDTPTANPQAPAAGHHTMLTPDQVKWGSGPPALPPGAQAAVLDGDLAKPGLFSIRLKFPDNYSIPAHWHPTEEHVVVLSGTFMMGVGDKLNDAALNAMPPGGFIRIPRNTNHFVRTKGETIVQVYGMGPFVLNYVNSSDDPRKKTSASK